MRIWLVGAMMTGKAMSMKRLLSLLLALCLMVPLLSYAEPTRDEMAATLGRIKATIYEVYGNAEDKGGKIGIFNFMGRIGYDTVPWYRTNINRTVLPFEQVGKDLFSYDKLEKLFANPEINNLFFCYCYNLDSGDFDKVMMVTITREAFETIIEADYETMFFADYAEVYSSDKQLFPQYHY